jgi:hypothetical protein
MSSMESPAQSSDINAKPGPEVLTNSKKPKGKMGVSRRAYRSSNYWSSKCYTASKRTSDDRKL